MDVRISAKWPGLCSTVVAGIAVGAVNQNHYWWALLFAVLFVVDCLKLDKVD